MIERRCRESGAAFLFSVDLVARLLAVDPEAEAEAESEAEAEADADADADAENRRRCPTQASPSRQLLHGRGGRCQATTSVVWLVLRQAWWSFRVHEGSLLSGAVAFYALLALAPFGVIAVWVAGAVVGADVAREQMQVEFSAFVGHEASAFLAKVVDRAGDTGAGSCTRLTLATNYLV